MIIFISITPSQLPHLISATAKITLFPTETFQAPVKQLMMLNFKHYIIII